MKTLVLGTLFVFASIAQGEQHAFSPKLSKLNWEGKKVVGGSHQGTLEVKSGHITFNESSPTSLQVVVDMTTLKNTDLSDPDLNNKLVGHLNSEDFFGSDKHPESRIEIDSIKQQKDGRYKMSGKLTIKGITKPIQLFSRLERADGKVSALVADLEFDRTDFGVRYGSGRFFENLGDKMISDRVKVSVSLKLEKPVKLAEK